jgi:hypothetical protein
MGVVIETSVKHSGGPIERGGADMLMVPIFIRSTGVLINKYK